MPISDSEIRELKEIARDIRKDIVDVTGWAGGSHIGGGMSLVEMLVILYFKYLNIDPANPDDPERDRFVLSKGHGGVAYAPVLAKKGYFDKELLREFNHFKSPTSSSIQSACFDFCFSKHKDIANTNRTFNITS